MGGGVNVVTFMFKLGRLSALGGRVFDNYKDGDGMLTRQTARLKIKENRPATKDVERFKMPGFFVFQDFP